MKAVKLAWELKRYKHFRVWELLHIDTETFLRAPQHYVIRAVIEAARYERMRKA
ncbi:MAG: hypothetical protein WC262_09465 [Bacteroidales bacterium]|jgi:hypothetical protein